MVGYVLGSAVLLWGLVLFAFVGLLWRRNGELPQGQRLGLAVLGGLARCSLGLSLLAAAADLGRPFVLTFALGALIQVGVVLAFAAWRFPAAVRLIGDPLAWRGERKAPWQR